MQTRYLHTCIVNFRGIQTSEGLRAVKKQTPSIRPYEEYET